MTKVASPRRMNDPMMALESWLIIWRKIRQNLSLTPQNLD